MFTFRIVYALKLFTKNDVYTLGDISVLEAHVTYTHVKGTQAREFLKKLFLQS